MTFRRRSSHCRSRRQALVSLKLWAPRSLSRRNRRVHSSPAEKIVPYVRQPEEVVPAGRSITPPPCTRRRRHRPAGREPRGPADEDRRQPEHPQLGASDTFAQRAILELYDPDRVQTPHHVGEIVRGLIFSPRCGRR